MTKRLTLDEAEEMARVTTRQELEKYEIPSDLFGKVVLTTLFEEDDRVFVLYVPGETRDNPIVIARTRVNLQNGNIRVEVPGWSLKAA
jgi:hypothetical protein